jgi:YD repeat-containing protein
VRSVGHAQLRSRRRAASKSRKSSTQATGDRRRTAGGGPLDAVRFDTVGHLVDLTSPDSGHTSYRDDLAGRLIAKQTPNLVTGNKVITYAYDFSRLKSLDLPSTPGVID